VLVSVPMADGSLTRMQRGILKHYAHVLPRIFEERILWDFQTADGIPEDVATLASWGSGHLAIDVIGGTCVRDHAVAERLRIVWEL
jgi:hypothetical protein